ncbi:hypothetical protein TMU01_30450 [Tenuibacillus multivorans]|uniref:Uncharacterized protein n=1 Tax=Tenuibacillus multivorans TaxID=237069 RepID=A0A1H0G5D0_9BACI|nr:hypothetical protein [Tenuibacillus multivorans]GEL78810.1 hypothetical protein TMU01_30450 [Tenuibacillus multivorans]SDO02098.1 hypothetical protein SAMN05216498_0461 [Tenuibacillus multivorans]
MYRNRFVRWIDDRITSLESNQRRIYFVWMSILLLFSLAISIDYYYQLNKNNDKFDIVQTSDVFNTPLILSLILAVSIIILGAIIIVVPFSIPKRIKFDRLEIEMNNELEHKTLSLRRRVAFISSIVDNYEGILYEILRNKEINIEDKFHYLESVSFFLPYTVLNICYI